VGHVLLLLLLLLLLLPPPLRTHAHLLLHDLSVVRVIVRAWLGVGLGWGQGQ